MHLYGWFGATFRWQNSIRARNRVGSVTLEGPTLTEPLAD